jgi:hypothetical protein
MQGRLEKMITHHEAPIRYELVLSEQKITLNSFIGKSLYLNFSGKLSCIHCHQVMKKSFNQGYCYGCFSRLAQCDLCIVRPETCHYAAGTCRDSEWALAFCFQPHIVYLANTSGLKVGITRHTQIPTRWIDQGAIQALPIMKVASRFLAGQVEALLAKYVNDKTHWQKMLKNQIAPIDLKQERDSLLATCADALQNIQEKGSETFEILNAEQWDLAFPIEQAPQKIIALNFDKQPVISGTLQGIKGQYLLLDTGVLNIRKFAGYEISLTLD